MLSQNSKYESCDLKKIFMINSMKFLVIFYIFHFNLINSPCKQCCVFIQHKKNKYRYQQQIIPVGCYFHDASLQYGLIIISNSTYEHMTQSADGTYAVNTTIHFNCNHGFWRDGPEEVICTTSGAWKPNTTTLCHPSNTNKNSTKLHFTLIITHKVHIIDAKILPF